MPTATGYCHKELKDENLYLKIGKNFYKTDIKIQHLLPGYWPNYSSVASHVPQDDVRSFIKEVLNGEHEPVKLSPRKDYVYCSVKITLMFCDCCGEIFKDREVER